MVGLVGTVKKPSVVGVAFSSRGGNPRSLRISISGVSFHKPSSVLLFLFIAFFQKNLALVGPRTDASCFRRPVASPDLLSAPRFQRSRMEIASSSCPFLGQAGFQAWPIGFALDHEIVGVAGKTIDGTLRPHGIGKRG